MRHDSPAARTRFDPRLAVPLALALAAGTAFGQATAPASGDGRSGAPQALASTGHEPRASGGQPEAGGEPAPAEGEQAKNAESAADAKPASMPGVAILARWVKSSACRICFRLPIDSTTHISMPDRESAARGWRVSLPTFEGAHVVMPPARAMPHARAEKAKESSAGTETAAQPESRD
ncbi:MAG: hypothetical protein IPJ41_01850 [Phycisphaerales bacterium]|nr:hypothetical protein [Phycisphaerales bacterium]